MTQRFHRSRDGFALIITVVLVAFLVLILVGLATFTRVETQVADNTADIAKARQNAMEGLNIALGQLQRHAGPDGRVTARSDLVGGVGPNNQSYFTGVWKTDGGAAPGAVPDAWLVSGTEGDESATETAGIVDQDDTFASPTDDANDSVYLLYKTSNTPETAAGANAAQRALRVKLKKQTIEVPASSVPGWDSAAADPVVGHYAYWVADEGIKASASIAAPDLSALNYNNIGVGGDNWQPANATSDELRARLAQFAQPYRRIDAFYPGMDYFTGATAAELARMQNIEQLLFVTNTNSGAAAINNYFSNYHDVTPLARGVLARTDVPAADATDRLRRDLSAAAITAGAADGLYGYWTVRPSSVGGSGFSAIYDVNPRVNGGLAGLDFAVAPVLSEAGIFFTFAPGATGLELSAQISAEFWNPYAATVRTQANKTLRVRVKTKTGLAAPLVFSAEDSTAPTPVTHTISVPADTFIATAEVPAAVDFGPGQIRLLRTVSSGAFDASGSSGFSGTGLQSASVFTPIITSYGLPTISDGDLIMLLEASDGSGNWTTLQEYELPGFSGGSALPPPGGQIYAGYGFELTRNFSRWSNPTGKDPRALNLSGSDYEALGSGNWVAAAQNNTTPAFASGAPLLVTATTPSVTPPPVILFDLPRQEISSVAQLRHMIANNPYSIMAGNAGIFDTRFVSTVPRNYANWTVLTEARPNRYLEVYIPPRAPAGEVGSDSDTDAQKNTARRDSLLKVNDSARYQLIRGAFNVNSTSVAAWKAVLGASLQDWDTETDTAADVNRAFFRTPHGAQEKGLANLVITNINGDDPPAPANAKLDDDRVLSAIGRRLTSDEVDALAQRIVAKLKTRNRPFASLAEFVQSSLLEEAITNDDAADNTNLNNDVSTSNRRFAAGALTKGDIVAAIAPFMSVRSDTFKIRAYGDAQNPMNEEIVSRAWCEAVVQRVPDLAPTKDEPGAAAADVADVVRGDPGTYVFGRQFKIISFRWLSTDDI